MGCGRRDFLSTLGGLVATAALPSLADDPGAFPLRGRYERLTLAYQRIDVGTTAPFSILHISDTHLSAAYPNEADAEGKLKSMERRTKTFGGRQEEALRDSLAWAKDNVDYVIHTGDLIDWQSRANFDLVKKYFGDAMFGSLGNHEYTPDMWLSDPKETNDEAWKDRTRAQLAATYPFDISLHSQIVNGVNFVTIDDVYGTVTAGQVERFRAEVAKGLPIVLCMHVPFFTDDIWLATTKFWARAGRKFEDGAVPPPKRDYLRQKEDPVTRDFIAYLKGEKLLKAILAGHLHITVQDRFSPTAMQYVVGGNYGFVGQEVIFT
jgi:3',5'-cyclic AMP phosphodiesterase CpdA